METIAALEHISFGYEKNVPILKDISLEIKKGEIVGLAGGNGSGKSTLLKIMAGFIRDYRGTVHIAEAVMENLACVIDGSAVFEDLSVGHNLEMITKMSKNAEGRKPDENLIDLLDLRKYYRRKASKLSLGNQQKLALCMALHQDTALALLDEPFNGLDPMSKARLLHYLKQRADSGMSILMTSHIRGDLELLCDRLIEIEKTGEKQA